jgi:NAD(P)H-dependent flavin oxidoreductase YrpB (nitropropane dioxygenase family)
MNAISTRLTARFGCQYPFACAGMAFAGETADLAVAVTNAGGIGAVGVGFTPAEPLREVIREVRDRTDAQPFNVNFITFFDNAEQVRVCAEEQVPIASFHWGHPPADQLQLLHEAGVSVWEQVGSPEAARLAVDDGVEIIVAQGWEAGGHNYGGLPTMVNVPAIVDAVGDAALVLAAGGITDGRQVAAALCLGADGVWVGTRLVASREARVHPEHHRRMIEASGQDTVRSAIFGPEWPAFNPMRLQRNRVVTEWNDRLAEVPTERDGLEEVGTTAFLGKPTVMRKFNVLLPVPETTADWEEMPWLMGQGVGLINSIEPAGDIVRRMMNDAAGILAAFSSRT